MKIAMHAIIHFDLPFMNRTAATMAISSRVGVSSPVWMLMAVFRKNRVQNAQIATPGRRFDTSNHARTAKPKRHAGSCSCDIPGMLEAAPRLRMRLKTTVKNATPARTGRCPSIRAGRSSDVRRAIHLEQKK